MKYYIGIDLGTSSVKLMLTDSEGVIKKSVTKEYGVCYPHPAWSEQNAEDWWNAICEGLPELIADIDGQSVKGIGVAGQMHGLVVLDKYDNVIRPVILWNDGRTDRETAYLNEEIGKKKLFEYTGNIAFAGFTAPKIMWLRGNEPESFEKISKIMLPKDYINYLLTGTHCTDYSDAAGMLLLDVENKCWSREMLDICGISEEQLPKLYESFESVGNIKAEIADKFGISKNTVVVAGAGDNAAAEEMREMVQELPSQTRETVVLKYFSGMSIEEIAVALSIPPGTVKSRLFNAKRILADRFRQTGQKGQGNE